MIFIFLIVLIVALIVANVLVSVTDHENYYEEQHKHWGKAIQPEIIMPVVKKENESDFLDKGKVIANEQKIKIMNQRVSNLEKALTEFAQKQISGKVGNSETVDIEKMNFRLKVLEQELDNMKNPKKKENTFYGQKNDPMEETIKSLVFNSKKK
jgi:hypothetical protein